MGKLLLSFILIITFFLKNADCQTSSLLSNKREYLPVLIVYCPAQVEDSISKILREYILNENVKYHIVMIQYHDCSSVDVATSVNKLLNAPNWFDKQKAYLLLLGDADFNRSLESLNKSFFADTYFQNINDQVPLNWSALFARFDKKYVWGIDVFEIENKAKTEVFQKRDWNIGLYTGFHNQSDFNKDSTYLPSFYTTYGVSLDYRLSAHLHLQGRLGASIKIPSKKKLQNQIQNQLGQSDGNGNQSITIEIATHIIIVQSLQANYLFRLQKKWQPYLGVGIMLVNFTASHKKERKSISSSSSSGSLESAFVGSSNIPIFAGAFVNPFVSFGEIAKISDNTSIVLNGNLTIPNGQTYQGVKPTFGFQNLSFQLGMSFKLGKKAKYYYNYVQ